MGKLLIRVGRSGVGKTQKMLKEIRDDKSATKHIIITPDQLSHGVERELCAICGDEISIRGEVLTFSRLSNHIFHHCGGLDDPELDKGGRVLLLHQSVNKCQEYLEVLSHYSQQSSFFDKLMKTVDELKTNRVPTELLLELDPTIPEQKKIHDIALICGFYDGYTRGFGENQEENLAKMMGVLDFQSDLVAFDPRDRYSRAADALADSSWGEEKTFWIDGFTDFTPQQLDILQHLMGQGDKMTVNLIGDVELMGDVDSLFAPSFLTMEKLEERANRENIPYFSEEIEASFSLRCSELEHLERELFEESPKIYENSDISAVKLFSALNPRTEVEWVASEILELVRHQGQRFRDILVVARDFSAYRTHIESVFPRYQIPVFTTEMTSILDKPVISVVKSVFQAINSHFSMEDMLSYLKTGFSSLKRENVDELEEYVLSWEENNWRSPWDKHSKRYDGNISLLRLEELEESGDPAYEKAKKSYESNLKTLMRLNLYREWAMRPLLSLEKAVENASGKAQCLALYNFLEEIHLYGNIKARQEILEAEGNLAQSQEYKQLWEILCSAMEQCHQLFSDEIMNFNEFSKVFTLVLSQYTVGTIPVSLDQVTAGETTRLKSNRCKTVFWLGCEDSVVPLPSNSGGLLTDVDRAVLNKLNISLNQDSERLLYREMTTAYEICALAEEKIYFTFPSRNMEGESLRPCFLIERIKNVFPSVKVSYEEELFGVFRLKSPQSALEQTSDYPFLLELLVNFMENNNIDMKLLSADVERGKLSNMAVSALYGNEITMSATSLRRLNSCQFGFFLDYGLKVKGRKKMEFSAAEYGNLVHFILEKAMRRYINVSDEIKKREMEQADVLSLAESYIENELGGRNNKSARDLFLLERMKTYVVDVVTEVVEELNRSKFTYLGGEIQFHSSINEIFSSDQNEFTVRFQGSVDRVDGLLYEDKLYLHLVDYKTGTKTVEYQEILDGRDIQLLLYYLALKSDKSHEFFEKFGGETAVSLAGLSFLPGKTESTSFELEKKKNGPTGRKNVKHAGMFLNNETLLYSLEKPVDGKFRYIPVTLDSDGDIKEENESLFQEKDFELLLKCAENHLSKITSKITCGDIFANPFYIDKKNNACYYCEYKAACHFNTAVDSRRNVEILKKNQAIELLTEKGGRKNET